MLTIKLYDDPAVFLGDASEAMMTCQIGIQLLQEQVSRNDSMTVDCLMPRYNSYIPPTKMLTDVAISEITPSHAFIDDLNITTYVEAIPLYNVSTLMCRF